jgi:hypothetical protein
MNTAKTARVRLGLTGVLALLGACMGDIQPEPSSRPDLRVVFQAAYSKEGRFTITEDREGWLGAGITGTTGADDPADLERKLHRSLVDTHKALLPGAEVPATLVLLDDRFMAQYAKGTRPRADIASPAALTAAASAASASQARRTRPLNAADRFNQDFCRYRNDNGFSSIPSQCWYVTNQPFLCYWVSWHDDGTDAFPASYAKNDGASGASLYSDRVALTVYPGQWALAVHSRESQVVCFDYEGTEGNFGLTQAIGQFDN